MSKKKAPPLEVTWLPKPYTPQKLEDVEIVFPGHVGKLMPTWGDLPVEFQKARSPWCRLARNLFFGEDLASVAKLGVRPGLDHVMAVRHLKAILGSFEPSHEHKIGAVGLLLKTWFTHPDIPEAEA